MQIFISYSRTDQAIAKQIADDLSTQGYKLWIDTQNIPHGSHWDSEVQRGLDESDVMIVLLSPASVSSQNVADEWSYFIGKGKRIQPVLVQQCEVPFRLMRLQRVDMTHSYQKGITELLRALNESPTGEDWAGTPLNAPSAANFNNTAWADHYHWWRGLTPQFSIGEISVLPTEWWLVAPDQLPMVIPINKILKAQIMKPRWDAYLKIVYQDAVNHSRQLVISAVDRRSRAATIESIQHALSQSAGHTLDK